MRPLFAILIVTAILGGMKAYMVWRPRPKPPQIILTQNAATGIFSLEATVSFAAGPDPFSLDLGNAPSLTVLFQGDEILRHTDAIEAGHSIQLDDVKGITEGSNEFYVQASPQEPSDAALAIRLRVLRDGWPIADQTLWSEPGEIPQGTVTVDVPAQSATHADDKHGSEDVRADETESRVDGESSDV